jgi:hypothetical protein
MALGLEPNGVRAADGRVKSNDPKLVVFSTPVYDDGTVGDRQELTFDLIDAGLAFLVPHLDRSKAARQQRPPA